LASDVLEEFLILDRSPIEVQVNLDRRSGKEDPFKYANFFWLKPDASQLECQ
jgi:hypothetical protein